MKSRSLKILGGAIVTFLIAAALLMHKDTAKESVTEAMAPKKADSKFSAPTQVEAPTYTPIAVPADASERDKKVAASLNKFMERTDGITAESVAEERERIKEGLKKNLEAPTETPQATVVKDENGDKWEKLEYKDGIVRYVPIASTLSRND